MLCIYGCKISLIYSRRERKGDSEGVKENEGEGGRE